MRNNVNDEKTWVLQAQNGSDEAFTYLVETYQTPVYNLCYRMLGHAESAEDAAQETFLRAYQHIRRYDPQRPFATWLLSIAAHYCIDRMRRKKLPAFSVDENEENTFSIPDAGAPLPEMEAIQGEHRERIHALLGHLDTIDRAAIVMRYWYDFSEKEIAESLNLTISAVKSRLHRARKKLGNIWEESATPAHVERRIYDESPAF
jgi:RNA polymerase sigma-70 factor (ECF subfamily)